MHEKRISSRIGLLVSLAVGLGIVIGISVGRVGAAPGAPFDMRLITEASKVIQAHYVDRKAVRSRALTYGAIAGMVRGLGDAGHSVFLTPGMRRMERQFIRGKLEGIGVEVQMKAGHLVVVAPIDGSPAARAGLRAGDVILRVNGQNISGMSLVQSVELIKGPAGSSIALTVAEKGTGRTREVRLVRASIKVPFVTWARIPGTRIADLRITAFNDGVARSLRRALKQIRNGPIAGIILDLRNNPGGKLTEAVHVASQFLEGGNVLLVKDARGKVTPVPVEKGGLATSVSLVALVNGGTASAAEIVAGALQAAHRARLVGQTTFATGTVLVGFPLSDGSELMLAVEEWLTPDGRTIWHHGIRPDVDVAPGAGGVMVLPQQLRGMDVRALRDRQLTRAARILEAGQTGEGGE